MAPLLGEYFVQYLKEPSMEYGRGLFRESPKIQKWVDIFLDVMTDKDCDDEKIREMLYETIGTDEEPIAYYVVYQMYILSTLNLLCIAMNKLSLGCDIDKSLLEEAHEILDTQKGANNNDAH